MTSKSTQTRKVSSRPGLSVGCQCGEDEPALCSSLLVRRAGPLSPAASCLVRASPSQHCIYQLKRPEPTVAKELSLFRDDLIDIVGEKNDKRLRLLYSSPERDDYPSFINLAPLPNVRQNKPGGLKKRPPWR